MTPAVVSSRLGYRQRLAISGVCCTLVVLAFMFFSPGCRHWFVIPTLLCGVIVGTDAIEWISGQTDTFDPIGLIGLLGVHFFFLAPLMQAGQGFWLEQWTLVKTPPPDWRPWIGYLAALTVPGLMIYRAIAWRVSSGSGDSQRLDVHRVDERWLLKILFSGMLLSLVLQFLVYWATGGVSGYIYHFVNLQGGRGSGLGRLFVLSESFPLLGAMAFAIWGSRRSWCRSLPVLAVFMTGTLAACLFFGGLRGSRSATIWVLFLAVGLVHFLIRRMTRRTVVFGLFAMALFMYGYGFLKWGGTEGLAWLTNRSARAEWSTRTNKTMLRTLVFDLSRSNVQAYLLYRLSISDDYSFGYGRTYLSALALIIPQSVWPGRPPGKEKEGSALQYGARSRIRSRWAYGLSGEAILNFGPIGVPLLFAPLGLLVGFARRLAMTLQREDFRWLLQPLLVALCFKALAFDAGNIVVFLFKYGLVMVFPIALCLFLQRWFPVSEKLTEGGKSMKGEFEG